MGLLRERRGELTADFRRFYGDSIDGFRSRGVGLVEVAAMAANFPPDSAVARSYRDPDRWTRRDLLLRAIEHDLRVIHWGNMGAKKSAFPDPIPLSDKREPREGQQQFTGKPVSIEEMAARLGVAEKPITLKPRSPSRTRDARGRFVRTGGSSPASSAPSSATP